MQSDSAGSPGQPTHVSLAFLRADLDDAYQAYQAFRSALAAPNHHYKVDSEAFVLRCVIEARLSWEASVRDLER